MPGVVVDGRRPAVEWVTTLPQEWKLTPPERHILLCLACDAFTWESAPGYDAIAEWTGMHRSSCIEILNRLCEKTEMRPAVLLRDSVKGRRRTVFRFNLADVQPSVQDDGSQGADQTGDGESTVGEPSGQADPSGGADGSIRPARTTVEVADEPPTVGQPSANRPVETTPPLPSPNYESQKTSNAAPRRRSHGHIQGELIDVPARSETREEQVKRLAEDQIQRLLAKLKPGKALMNEVATRTHIQRKIRESLQAGREEDRIVEILTGFAKDWILRPTQREWDRAMDGPGPGDRPKNIRDINRGMDNGQDFTAGTRYGGRS